MLGLIFIIIVAIFTFRTARQNGYNPYGWTALSVVLFFGFQVLAGMIFGVVMIISTGTEDPAEALNDYAFLLGLLSLIPGVAVSLLILRHVNQIREDAEVSTPPPPGSFGLD